MIKIYVDAATKGNPGPSGAGVLIVEKNQQIPYKFLLPVMTNHEAEFQAAIKGLRQIPKEKRNEPIFLYTDSKLVVEAVKKRHVSHLKFQSLLKHLLFLVDSFSHLEITWQPDSQHKGAHHLAQQALHLLDS